jgi:hypothetical protein
MYHKTPAQEQLGAPGPEQRTHLYCCWCAVAVAWLIYVMPTLLNPTSPAGALMQPLCLCLLLPARREAERDAAAEPLLSSFLYATILAHDSFERALAFVLSNRLANTVMLPTQLFETFYEVLISDADVRQGALADVEACRERVSHCNEASQRVRQLVSDTYDCSGRGCWGSVSPDELQQEHQQLRLKQYCQGPWVPKQDNWDILLAARAHAVV